MIRENLKGVGGNLTRLMTLGLLVGAASCDTTVVNPGPIDSNFLDDQASQVAITNGAGRALADALNWIAYTGAAISREVHPSGSTGSFGITPEQQRGELNDDEVGTQWNNAHRARFLASDGVARILSLDASEQNSDNLAQLYLWGGYSNRLLGESMCQAVVDGGAAEANTDTHLQAAIAMFNSAQQLGSGDVAMAAIAGRAAAHVALGDWASAVADAAQVPMGFSYDVPYFDIGDDNQSNRIYVAGKAAPYKAHSQIFTWIADYNPEVNGVADMDPRVSWRVSGENGDAASSCCGLIAWNPQTKYTDDDAGIELSSYEEMQLIIAENQIMNNGAAGMTAGMAIINALRTAAMPSATPLTAANQAEAMTWLKREHAIEMWLEGRRLPAMRRWHVNNTPGDLQPMEQIGDGDTATGSHLAKRDFCFPISEGEQDTNLLIAESDVTKISS